MPPTTPPITAPFESESEAVAELEPALEPELEPELLEPPAPLGSAFVVAWAVVTGVGLNVESFDAEVATALAEVASSLEVGLDG